jgi:D-xylose transport system ATP-binding protein
MSAPASEAAQVELVGISKRFGGVHAVEEASLDLRAGEVVALVGHNGAGKSTLIKILAGALLPDAGEIRIDGRPVHIRSPRDARRLGIEAIHQNLALADNLDATANLFLGREQVTRLGTLDERVMESAARRALARLNPGIPPTRVQVRDLSGGERQAVAIARALQFDARILILDEPTASLGPAEAHMLGELVRRLRGQGLGIFLVSHDLHDVLALADRIAVMRSGRVVGTLSAREASEERLLGLILGTRPA